MNILIYTEIYCGPTMTFLYRQVTALRKNGHDVTVICRSKQNIQRYPFEDVVEIPRRMSERLFRSVLRKLRVSHTFITRAVKSKIRNIIVSKNIDVVLSHFGPSGLEINQVARACKLPHFVIIHGFDGSLLLRKRDYRNQWKRNPDVRRFYASRSMELNMNRAGLHANYGVVLPLGFADDNFSDPGGPIAVKNIVEHGRRFIFQAANFVEKKGQRYTVRAFSGIAAQCKDLDLVFAGDGPDRQAVEKEVKRLGLGGRVHFLGHIGPSQVIDCMDECAGFVHHSVTASNGDQESIPTCIMEAMSRGCLVISTCHSGIPELISSGINGFLVAERDVKKMASRILAVWKMGTEERETMSRLAHDTIKENFNFDKQLVKIETQLLAAVNEG